MTYKVLKEKLEGEPAFSSEMIGTNVELDETVGVSLIEEGVLEVVPEEEVVADKEVAEVLSQNEVAPKLYFNGKLILSDTVREVEGRQINHVTLEDGTQTDLTAEEYQAVLSAAK